MTVPFSVRDVIAWTACEWIHGSDDVRFSGASIDTRTLAPGELFVAIAGERHDAHAFLQRALESGAAGLLVQRDRALPEGLGDGLPVLAVPDTTPALGALAAGHRSGHRGPLVAITGSNGKTTTKEMCAAILSVGGPCLKNEGNLNNEFGLPLTLLRRDAAHSRVIVELGMNHRGEIARLARIARPTVGVVTNVGTAHIEFLGSREAIAEEKGDLVAALEADGVAVLNADDPFVQRLSERTQARTLLFGTDPEAHVRAETVRAKVGGFSFDLVTPAGRTTAEIAGLGRHAVVNALAAAAAALACDVPLEELAAGLARYRPVAGRLEPIALPGGGLVINDTYNANPQSMELALRTLADLRGDTRNGSRVRGIAVLGDMGELGDASEVAHREAGKLAASLGIDHLYAVGAHAAQVAEGARAAGMDADRVHVGSDWEDTGERVTRDLRSDDHLLVKGSRAMRMERIVALITRAASGRSAGSDHADGGAP